MKYYNATGHKGMGCTYNAHKSKLKHLKIQKIKSFGNACTMPT